jgi:GAF domain-containing protein
MKEPPQHEQEEERLDALHARALIERTCSPQFDPLLRDAAKALNVPISTVTLIDAEKEIHKACLGLDSAEGPRNQSFCGHALVTRNVLVCEDTHMDERFKDNPYVVGPPFVRFYMGARLFDNKSGLPIGVFCVKDKYPRNVSMEQLDQFMSYAEQAQDLLDEL